MKDTLLGAISTQLMTAGNEVVSLYHRRIEHGYPTPSLGRDEILDKALPWLQQQGIWSRGRFGSYKVGCGGGWCSADLVSVLSRAIVIAGLQQLCNLLCFSPRT